MTTSQRKNGKEKTYKILVRSAFELFSKQVDDGFAGPSILNLQIAAMNFQSRV